MPYDMAFFISFEFHLVHYDHILHIRAEETSPIHPIIMKTNRLETSIAEFGYGHNCVFINYQRRIKRKHLLYAIIWRRISRFIATENGPDSFLFVNLSRWFAFALIFFSFLIKIAQKVQKEKKAFFVNLAVYSIFSGKNMQMW